MSKSLKAQLSNNLDLLSERKRNIEKYKDQPAMAGKHHYSEEQIPELDKLIADTQAAIWGIQQSLRCPEYYMYECPPNRISKRLTFGRNIVTGLPKPERVSYCSRKYKVSSWEQQHASMNC